MASLQGREWQLLSGQFRQQIIHKLHSGTMYGGNEDPQQSPQSSHLFNLNMRLTRSSLSWRRTTKSRSSLVLSSYCIGGCMTGVFTANHTKLVTMCGCTPLFWLMETRWSYIIHGQDHSVWSRGTYKIQSLSNPCNECFLLFQPWSQ